MPSLVNGLGGIAGFGEGFLQSNDDRSTAAIDVTSIFGAGGLYLNGAHYTSLYINNNGNITFGGPLAAADAVPMGTPTSPVVIAPYWMDIDTLGPHTTSPGGVSNGLNLVIYDVDTVHRIFTATWDDVGYSPTSNPNPAAFQVQLIDAGNGDFDIAFIYENIGPAAADQPNIARAGFSLGATGGARVSYELAGSGNAAAMSTVDTTPGNTGQDGLWLWHIRGGLLIGPGGPSTDPPVTDPPHTDPPVTDPPHTDPPVTDPPHTDPPVTDPPHTDPPVTDPPHTDPPVTDPPHTDPPHTDPPHTDPPVTAPPVDPEPPQGSKDVSFSVSLAGLQREGDEGVTSYNVQIGRAGDLAGPSVVNWEIIIDDPNDLVPGQALSGTAFFGTGQTIVTIPIGVVGDQVFEQDDMFLFKLTSAAHGTKTFDPGVTGVGVIVNDDSPVGFTFAGPQSQAEGLAGATPFEFIVLRTGGGNQTSTVHWALNPGQADALDFAPGQPLTGEVVFAPGQTQATIVIQVAGDSRPEPDETFGLRLTSATTGTVTGVLMASTTGVILDDDLRHSLLVATPTALVLPEGNAGTTAFNFNLLRTGDLAQSVTTHYAITAPATGGVSAGEIQTPLTGDVTFAAGSAEAHLTVLVSGDTTPEDNESFQVALGGGDFNNLVLTGVVMNDDQNTGAASPAGGSPLAIAGMDGEATSFMQLLVGGSLWTGDGLS